MAERPTLGRDDSYNRVTVPRDLKSQIMSMIADSSESLPLDTVSESDEEVPRTAKAPLGVAPTNGTSNLAAEEPLSAADFATPTPEKPNPLEQLPTVRVDSKKPVAEEQEGAYDTDALGVVDLATPSPMRSHEAAGPVLGKLSRKISNMVSHSQTDLSGEKETLGTTASRSTTISATPSGAKEGIKTRPGMDKRQSTMKRISSAFKRTVSKA